MSWEVEWSNRARADVAALDQQIRRRVLAAIVLLSETREGNLQKLRASSIDEWRLRVGDWRVILTFDYPNNILTVMQVQHRREVYRRR